MRVINSANAPKDDLNNGEKVAAVIHSLILSREILNKGFCCLWKDKV